MHIVRYRLRSGAGGCPAKHTCKLGTVVGCPAENAPTYTYYLRSKHRAGVGGCPAKKTSTYT